MVPGVDFLPIRSIVPLFATFPMASLLLSTDAFNREIIKNHDSIMNCCNQIVQQRNECDKLISTMPCWNNARDIATFRMYDV